MALTAQQIVALQSPSVQNAYYSGTSAYRDRMLSIFTQQLADKINAFDTTTLGDPTTQIQPQKVNGITYYPTQQGWLQTDIGGATAFVDPTTLSTLNRQQTTAVSQMFTPGTATYRDPTTLNLPDSVKNAYITLPFDMQVNNVVKPAGTKIQNVDPKAPNYANADSYTYAKTNLDRVSNLVDTAVKTLPAITPTSQAVTVNGIRFVPTTQGWVQDAYAGTNNYIDKASYRTLDQTWAQQAKTYVDPASYFETNILPEAAQQYGVPANQRVQTVNPNGAGYVNPNYLKSAQDLSAKITALNQAEANFVLPDLSKSQYLPKSATDRVQYLNSATQEITSPKGVRYFGVPADPVTGAPAQYYQLRANAQTGGPEYVAVDTAKNPIVNAQGQPQILNQLPSFQVGQNIERQNQELRVSSIPRTTVTGYQQVGGIYKPITQQYQTVDKYVQGYADPEDLAFYQKQAAEQTKQFQTAMANFKLDKPQALTVQNRDYLNYLRANGWLGDLSETSRMAPDGTVYTPTLNAKKEFGFSQSTNPNLPGYVAPQELAQQQTAYQTRLQDIPRVLQQVQTNEDKYGSYTQGLKNILDVPSQAGQRPVIDEWSGAIYYPTASGWQQSQDKTAQGYMPAEQIRMFMPEPAKYTRGTKPTSQQILGPGESEYYPVYENPITGTKAGWIQSSNPNVGGYVEPKAFQDFVNYQNAAAIPPQRATTKTVADIEREQALGGYLYQGKPAQIEGNLVRNGDFRYNPISKNYVQLTNPWESDYQEPAKYQSNVNEYIEIKRREAEERARAEANKKGGGFLGDFFKPVTNLLGNIAEAFGVDDELAAFDKFVNKTIGWDNIAAIGGSLLAGPLGSAVAKGVAQAEQGKDFGEILQGAAISFAMAYGTKALFDAVKPAIDSALDQGLTSGLIDQTIVDEAAQEFADNIVDQTITDSLPDFVTDFVGPPVELADFVPDIVDSVSDDIFNAVSPDIIPGFTDDVIDAVVPEIVGPPADLADFVLEPVIPDFADNLMGPPSDLANFGDDFFGPPAELAGITEPVVPGALTAGTPGTEGFTQAELNAIAEGSQMAAGPQVPGTQYAQSVQVLPGPEIATDVLPAPPPYFPEDIPNVNITGAPVEPGAITDVVGGAGGISTPGGAISIGDVATVAVPVAVGGAVIAGAAGGGGGAAATPVPAPTPAPIQPPVEVTPGPVNPVPPVEPPVAVQPTPVEPVPVSPQPPTTVQPPVEVTPGPVNPVPPVEPPVAVQPPPPASTTPVQVDRISGPNGDIITYSDGSQYAVSNIPGSQPVQIVGPGITPMNPVVVPNLPDAVVPAVTPAPVTPTPAPVEPVPTPTTPEVIVPPVVPPVTPAPSGPVTGPTPTTPTPVEPVPVQPAPTAPTTPTPPSSEVITQPPGGLVTEPPLQPTVTPGAPGQAPVIDYSTPYTGEYSNESVLSRYLNKQITYGDILTLIAAGLVAPTVIGMLGGQPQQPAARTYGPLAPIQWGEFQGGLTQPGLNPGYLTFGGQPPAFYNVDSPVAGRYYWGMHPYMRTAEDLSQYNVVAEAPAQPFGVLQPRQPLDINRFIQQTIGTPEYQQAAMGGSLQYPGGIAPATTVAGGNVPQAQPTMSQLTQATMQTPAQAQPQYLAPAQIPQIAVPQVPQAQAQFAPVVAPPLTALPSWAPGQLDLTQPVAPFVPYTQATPV